MRPNRTRPRLVWIALVVVLVAGTVSATILLRNLVRNQNQQLLDARAAEAGLVLSSALQSTQPTLSVLGATYALDPNGSVAKVLTHEYATGGGLTAIITNQHGQLVVRVAGGTGLQVGQQVAGPRAALAHRALATNKLVADVTRASGSKAAMLEFATALPNGVVVYEEVKVQPDQLTQSGPNSPFSELQGALYAGPTANPSKLLFSTAAHLPLQGNVKHQQIDIGADRWLLVASARGSLIGSFAPLTPWIVLALGLLVSMIAFAALDLLLRRRAYALSLVAERTADLEATLTDLEAARTAAETANQSKSEFLSRMSHELRTPLNAVLGFAQLLELEQLDHNQHESVTQIVKGGRHLLELINEVLDIARIDTGNLALSAEPVLPNDIVSDVIDLVRPLAVERSISITTNLGASDAYVLADRQRLRQILLNLLSNAVKYNRIGGTITLACDQRDPTQLRITVTDTGPGIPADLHPKLFQPFERLGAEQTDIEGTGVGLALSRRLADAMGAKLDFQSTVGHGSTFWVELPVVEGPFERLERLNPLTHATATPNTRRHTILYIEDNLANIKLIEHIFATRGNIDLIPAIQGRLGLDLARRDPPALVLLDLHLPDIDGHEVLHALRADPSTAELPIVVLSADATERQTERLLANGATAYITKPIDVAEFLRTIDELLPVAQPAPAPTVTK